MTSPVGSQPRDSRANEGELPVYAPERQAEIVARTRTAGRIDVASLANEMQVTPETIRRDLKALERRGLVRRVHGGAIAVERVVGEEPVHQRESANAEAKAAIGRAALAEIQDAHSIVIDGGTTTACLAALLPTDRELTVITHALPIASIVAGRPNINLHLVGGAVRGRTLVAVGPWATRSLERVNADVVLLGANGVSVESGITTPDVAEAEVKAALIRSARRIVLLADHTKIGRNELITVVSLDQVDTLITDAGVDPDLVDEITAAGVTVVRA